MGIWGLGQSDQTLDTLYNNHLMGVEYLKDTQVNIVALGRARNFLMLSTNETETNRRIDEVNTIFNAIALSKNAENKRVYQATIFIFIGLLSIGVLAVAFNEMIDGLRILVKSIRTGSEEIVHAADALKSTSAQTANASEEVSRSITEIARGANEQAKDTEKAVENVVDMGDLLTKSNQVVQSVVHATDDNDQASGMIQNIADQTNLLALNAAIEAAASIEAQTSAVEEISIGADRIAQTAETLFEHAKRFKL